MVTLIRIIVGLILLEASLGRFLYHRDELSPFKKDSISNTFLHSMEYLPFYRRMVPFFRTHTQLMTIAVLFMTVIEFLIGLSFLFNIFLSLGAFFLYFLGLKSIIGYFVKGKEIMTYWLLMSVIGLGVFYSTIPTAGIIMGIGVILDVLAIIYATYLYHTYKKHPH